MRLLALVTLAAGLAGLPGTVGAQVVIEEPFSRDFSNTPAERFFSENLVHRLNARAVVVGGSREQSVRDPHRRRPPVHVTALF